MSPPTAPGYRLALILADTDRDEILTVRRPGVGDRTAAPDEWTLPSVAMADGSQVRDWAPMLAALIGSRVVMLRHETVASFDMHHPSLVVVEIEATASAPAAAPNSAVADGTWRPIRSLDLDHVEPILRATIERWRARHVDGIVSAQLPWSAPGWFDRASGWMLESLERAGREPTGRPVQHYLWSISSVLRCPTTTGDAYLKATSPIFPQEVAMTQLLATRTPGRTPAVIATEPREGWLLMADHEGRPLDEEPEATWPLGIQAHARIQRAWIDDLPAARAAGAVDRSLSDLASWARDLTANDGLMGRLDRELRLRYAGAVPRLVDACARLDALGIPDSLIHGDLHPGNIAVGDRGYIVFDWSDVAIGNPMIDLVPFVSHGSDLPTRRAIQDAYVAEWADLVDPDRLAEVVGTALPLGYLYQVVSYVAIRAALGPEDIDDMADADIDWIGRTVRALDDSINARST